MVTPDLPQALEKDYPPSNPKVSLPQHPLLTSITLHLLPGFVLIGFYLLVAPVAQRLGFPPAVASSLGILFALLPLELGIMLYQGRKEAGRYSLRKVIAYRRPVPLWQYLIFVPLLTIWFFQASSFWNNLQRGWFSGQAWYAWWENPLAAADVGPYSPAVLLITSAITLISSGIVAPIIEELYFRGFLLPRIERLGAWAILLNVSLFAIHHLWTPLVNPGRILAWLPIIFVVWRKQNIYIGFFVHMITNLAGSIIILFGLLSML